MHNGKSQADPLPGVCGVGLIVAVKDMCLYLFGHSDPVIGHSKYRLGAFSLEGDRDLAPVGGIFDGVPDQIRPHMGEQLLAPI